MKTYEEFCKELEERAERKRFHRNLKRFIIRVLSYFSTFLAVLGGTVLLQLGYGDYNFVKFFWILTVIVLIATVWYVVDECRVIFGGDDEDV